MALSPYLYPFRTSTTFHSQQQQQQLLPFLSKLPNFSVRRRFFHFSDDRSLSSSSSDDFGKCRAKPKDLILGNPSVILEKGKYSYDVETLINKLSSLPPRGSIARCLDIFKNRLSLNDFSLVFKEFAARGDWQRSLRLFKYMQRQIWCKPNEHIYTIMISLLGREGLLDKCTEIFDEMATQGVIRTVFSYTALINAYGRNGQYQTSLQLLERMKRDRVSPNILTYNTVINACARGDLDWEGLLGLFAEMRHEGVQPDLVTYNTLLSACAARGLGDEAEMVFKTMIEGGIVPEITTYSYIVETFGNLEFILSRWGNAYELFNEMIKNRVTSIHRVIGQMIKGDYDDGSNWQMVEYVFDKLNIEGYRLGMRFHITLLEALWWLGQKVHRTWEGMYNSIKVNKMNEMLMDGEDLPQLAEVVVGWGWLEKNSTTQNLPIAKVVYSFLQDNEKLLLS